LGPETKKIRFTQQESPLRIVIDCSFDGLMTPQAIPLAHQPLNIAQPCHRKLKVWPIN